MLRYLLAAYLMLPSLMGPIPCCCVLARFAAPGIAAAKTEENSGEGSPVERHGCCHRDPKSGAQAKQRAQGNVGPARGLEGPAERCDCEKNLCNAAGGRSTGLVTRAGVNDLTVQVPVPLTRGDDGFLFAVAVKAAGTPPAARSGREIRIEMHSWRC